MFFPIQYKRVMWGLIIALLDIRIGPIDILPDFMGYILITMGLSELAEQHVNYGKAKNFSQWLILFSLTDIYKVSGNSTYFSISNSGIFFMFISMVGVMIKLFMVYYICRAIIGVSAEKGLDEIGRKSDLRWRAYLYINGAMLILMPFGIIIRPPYTAALIVPVIAALVIEILLISLVHTAGKELA